MIRFALIAASTLGFLLTAALGNLMVPLLRAFQSRGQERRAKPEPPPKAEPEQEELDLDEFLMNLVGANTITQAMVKSYHDENNSEDS